MSLPGPRASALLALVILLLLLGAVLAATTPWRPLPQRAGVTAVPPDPARDFSTAEIAREDDFHRAVRPPGVRRSGDRPARRGGAGTHADRRARRRGGGSAVRGRLGVAGGRRGAWSSRWSPVS
jgi:hypothetical protein